MKSARTKAAYMASGTVLAVLAAVVFGLSASVVWLGDDIDYAYFINDSLWNSAGSIDNVGDLLASQANHYMWVNGRFVAHTLVQFFCAIAGQWAFAVCNAVVWCLFVWLIMRVAGIRRPMERPVTLMGVASLAMSVFVTKMVPTTQIGFIWMMALSLAWLEAVFSARGRRVTLWLAVPAAVFGIIAGDGQEAVTLGLSFATFLWYVRRRGMVGGLCALLLWSYWAGTLAICLSPGTLHRAGELKVSMADSALYSVMALGALWILVAVIVRRRMSIARLYAGNRLFTNALLLLLAFNAVVGVYSNRQLFGAALMSLVILLRVLPRRRISLLWASVAVMVAAITVMAQIPPILDINRQYDTIQTMAVRNNGAQIQVERTLGSTCPVLRQFRFYEEIVGEGNADVHHSLQKQFHASYPGMRTLTVWPASFRRGTVPPDTVIEFAPDHYVVYRRCPDSLQIVRRSHLFMLPWLSRTDTIGADGIRPSVRGAAGWRGDLLLTPAPFYVTDTIILTATRR